MGSPGISGVLGDLNAHLQESGLDLEVGMKGDLPITLSFGPVEIETTVRVHITEDGSEVVDPELQAGRILREFLEEINRLVEQKDED